MLRVYHRNVTILPVNNRKSTYLYKSLRLLEKWLPGNAENLLQWYREHPENTDLEEDADGLAYCLFSYPVLNPDGKECKVPFTDAVILERIILLVYDHDQIIADCSALHGSAKSLYDDQNILHYLQSESDWMDLEQYVLSEMFFSDQADLRGEALLYNNAYVTTSYRQKGIFTRMLEMMREHALRNAFGNTVLYTILSLDPDVACYGPDTPDHPYVYSMKQDEPKRLKNAEIMKKLGYLPVRLEESEPSESDDGTKLWFALRKEEDQIIDSFASFNA